MSNNQIYKGGLKNIFKNKSALITFFMTLLATIPSMFLLNSKLLWDLGEENTIYMFFAISLGLTLINIQELVLDLTMLDKLNKRIEFLLSNGLNLKDIVSNYSRLIFSISILPSFILMVFMTSLSNLKTNVMGIVILYISIFLFSYFLISLINVLIFKIKRYKLLKNILFFGSFLIIWLMSNFGQDIVLLINKNEINMVLFLIIILFSSTFMISVFHFFKKRNLTNESALKVESKWE